MNTTHSPNVRQLTDAEIDNVSGASILSEIGKYVLTALIEAFAKNSSGHQHTVGDGCSMDHPR